MIKLPRRYRGRLVDLIALTSVIAVAGTLLFLRPPWEQLAALEWDEGYYVGLARGIATGQSPWLFPVDFEGTPIGDKPPVFLWCMAASIKVFGDSLYAVRLPSAIAAFLAVVLMFLLGRRVVGRTAAWSASMVLATAPMVYFPHASWSAVMEAPTLLLCTLILLAALWAVADDGGLHPRYRALALGTLIGLLFMVKSGVVLLPLLVLAVALPWLTPKQRSLLPTLALYGAPAAIVVGGMWPLAALVAGEGERMVVMWGDHVFDRATTDIGTGASSRSYLFERFFAGLGPWCFVVAVSVLRIDRLRRAHLPFVLAWLWLLVTIGSFSLLATQWYWYVLPAAPAAALLLGVTMGDISRRRSGPVIAAAIGLATGAGLLYENIHLLTNNLIGPFDDSFFKGITLWLQPIGDRGNPVIAKYALPATLAALLAVPQLGTRRESAPRTAGTTTSAVAVCVMLAVMGWGALRWAQWHVQQPQLSTGTIVAEMYITPEIAAELELERDVVPNTTLLRWLGLVQPFVWTTRPGQPTRVTFTIEGESPWPVTLEYLGDEVDDAGVRQWERAGLLPTAPGRQEIVVEVPTGPAEPFTYRFVSLEGTETADCVRALYVPRPSGAARVVHTYGRLNDTRTPEPLRSGVLCGRPEFLERHCSLATPTGGHDRP